MTALPNICLLASDQSCRQILPWLLIAMVLTGRIRYWDIFEGYFALGGQRVDTAYQETADDPDGNPPDERGSASNGQSTVSKTKIAALQNQLKGVAAAVDKIAEQQESYDKAARSLAEQQKKILEQQESYATTARGLAEQQKQILELLQTVLAKAGS